MLLLVQFIVNLSDQIVSDMSSRIWLQVETSHIGTDVQMPAFLRKEQTFIILVC